MTRNLWVATTINAPDLIHPVTMPIDQSPYSAPPCSTPFAINKAEIAPASSTTALRVVVILWPFYESAIADKVMRNDGIVRGTLLWTYATAGTG